MGGEKSTEKPPHYRLHDWGFKTLPIWLFEQYPFELHSFYRLLQYFNDDDDADALVPVCGKFGGTGRNRD